MVVDQYQTVSSVHVHAKQAQQYEGHNVASTDHFSPEILHELPDQDGQPIPRILVVDTDLRFVQQFTDLAREMGYEVVTSDNAADAVTRLQEHEAFDLLVIDPQAVIASEVDLVTYATERLPDIPLMAVTQTADLQSAVGVLKRGAVDYLIKPIRSTIIRESLRAIFEKTRLFMELRHLRRVLADYYDFSGMLSKTPAMHVIFERIRLVAPTNVTVLIEGETGTGKELVATAIHMQSARRQEALVSLNCAGIPDTLLESELFGYERCAFTGATYARPGKIELADQGTLFLDEIESMSLAMQAKLLLVLQNHTIQRLGSSRTRQIDMRVIAASNVPLGF